jgi:hypothetical protein
LKKTLEDGKISHIHGLAKLNIVKMAKLLKVIYRSNTISIKIPLPFFTEIERTTSNFLWKHKRL